MASLASINVRFSVDLRDFSTQMQNSLRQIDSAGQKLQSIGRGLSAAVTLPIVGLGIASLKTFGDIQALQKGLISVMGSSEAAAVEFEKLKEVAKLPGLGLEEAVRGSVNLQAAGFSADEARRALLSFGNALATVGKGKRELDLVTLAITQLNNKSGGFGQDLRQLTEQLPQLRGALQTAFGTVDTEAISKSGVTGKQVVNALITEFEKLPKVSGGINNAFENFADSSKLALSSFGDSINKAFNVEGLLNSLGETISRLAEKFSNLSPEAQKTIVVIAGVAAAIGPVLIAIGAVTAFVPSVVAGLVAIRAGVASLTATIAANPIGALAVALSLVVTGFILFRDTQKSVNDVVAEGNKLAATEISSLDKLYASATNVNVPIKERKKNVDDLQALFPAYFGNIKDEIILNGQAKKSYEDLRDAIFNKSRASAIDSEIQNRANERVQDEVKLREDIVATENEIIRLRKGANEIVLQEANAIEKTARVTISKENAVAAQVRLLEIQKQKLADFNKTALKSDEALFKAKLEYSSKTGKLDENEILLKNKVTAATSSMNLEQGKVIKSGTIEFYEAQISALQKTQKTVVDNFDAWNILESKIKDYQKQIDKIEGKAGVKLPKPQIDTTDPIAPPAFSLQDLGDQKTYFETLRLQFSTTSDEYQKLTEQINNTEIKINAIKGVEEFKAGVDEIKTKVGEFSSEVSSSISAGITRFAEGFTQAIIQGGNFFNSAGNLLLQTIGNIMVELGKAAITIGVTMLAIKAAFKTPLAAIAAGAALILAGTLVKSQVNDAGGFANGGMVGGTSYTGDKLFARVNSGEMILNQKQQSNLSRMINPAVTAGDVAIQLIGGLKISGSDLELVLMRNEKRNNRIK